MRDHRQIPSADLNKIAFGQGHPGTQEIIGAPPVLLPDFPHLALLRGGATGRARYEAYLDASWSVLRPTRNTPALRRKQAERLLDLRQRMARGEKFGRLVVVDGPRGPALVDGNHRAAAAYDLGLEIGANIEPLGEYLARLARGTGEAFYATGHRGMPYQSLFVDGVEVVQGRRRDTLRRMATLRPEDFAGASVLDLGCNTGSSSLLAAEMGASGCIGVDLLPSLVLSAIRLAAVLRSPCRYYQADLGEPTHLGPADVVLCFSVDAHLGARRAQLWQTIDRVTRRVLYLEGHAGTTRDRYQDILARFARVELIGKMGDGSHTSRASRPLWRCERG